MLVKLDYKFVWVIKEYSSLLILRFIYDKVFYKSFGSLISINERCLSFFFSFFPSLNVTPYFNYIISSYDELYLLDTLKLVGLSYIFFFKLLIVSNYFLWLG